MNERDGQITNYSYSYTEVIGKGSQAIVYYGKHLRNDYEVAIKVIDISNLHDEKAWQLLFSEVNILKTLSNPNIVKFIDSFQTKNNAYIVTEYCQGGTLQSEMKEKKYTEKEAINVIQNIMNGLYELHKNGIIHRDLKPANILIKDNVYKIVDFGFARFLDKFKDQIMESCVGTPLYMSPQILMNQTYTSKCDVYSLGLIFYELLFGTTPYQSSNLIELINTIQDFQLNFPQNIISDQAILLIKGTLEMNEEDRYSWEDVYNSVLFKQDEQKVVLIEGEEQRPVIYEISSQSSYRKLSGQLSTLMDKSDKKNTGSEFISDSEKSQQEQPHNNFSRNRQNSSTTFHSIKSINSPLSEPGMYIIDHNANIQQIIESIGNFDSEAIRKKGSSMHNNINMTMINKQIKQTQQPNKLNFSNKPQQQSSNKQINQLPKVQKQPSTPTINFKNNQKQQINNNKFQQQVQVTPRQINMQQNIKFNQQQQLIPQKQKIVQPNNVQFQKPPIQQQQNRGQTYSMFQQKPQQPQQQLNFGVNTNQKQTNNQTHQHNQYLMSTQIVIIQKMIELSDQIYVLQFNVHNKNDQTVAKCQVLLIKHAFQKSHSMFNQFFEKKENFLDLKDWQNFCKTELYNNQRTEFVKLCQRTRFLLQQKLQSPFYQSLKLDQLFQKEFNLDKTSQSFFHIIAKYFSSLCKLCEQDLKNKYYNGQVNTNSKQFSMINMIVSYMEFIQQYQKSSEDYKQYCTQNTFFYTKLNFEQILKFIEQL